ncbi:MAG: helix-turn-helix transcriptional regulator [Opitutales bacterium]|nr:helix-turn-helix transcriptional regulator [Opitutales bacterium]
MDFSEKLEILLTRNGMTQTKLSKELGISQAAIAKWIKGLSRPSPDKLLQIAKIFNVSIEVISKDNLSLPQETKNYNHFDNAKIEDDFKRLLSLRNEITETFNEFSEMFDKRLSNIEKILKDKKF